MIYRTVVLKTKLGYHLVNYSPLKAHIRFSRLRDKLSYCWKGAGVL